MKVAIATSGLGHVYRGMEVWAELTAKELFDRGIDVTLFRGCRPPMSDYEVCVPCIRRSTRLAKLLSQFNKVGGWRFGLGWPAQVETWSYGMMLLVHLRRGYDIVHIQQAHLALFFRLAQKLRLLRIPFILSNGQLATPEFLEKIKYVQFLTPLEKDTMQGPGTDNRNWFYLPNTIDVNQFRLMQKSWCRALMNIPEQSVVVLTVGAVQKYHKRIDYFLKEMKQVKRKCLLPMHFIVAGAKTDDTEALMRLAETDLGSQVTFFIDVPKEEMPAIYNCADIFTLCSLNEAFGYAYIEAMACELPVIHHTNPITEWIVGDGGVGVDLKEESALATGVLDMLSDRQLMDSKGRAGRQRVIEEFATDVVMERTINMYGTVVRSEKNETVSSDNR